MIGKVVWKRGSFKIGKIVSFKPKKPNMIKVRFGRREAWYSKQSIVVIW